jgi:hypothetical protein
MAANLARLLSTAYMDKGDEEVSMRSSEIRKPKPDSEPLGLQERIGSVVPGVPDSIAEPFLRGLDDVKSGRVVDGDAVIAESRAILARYRQKKHRNASAFTDGS